MILPLTLARTTYGSKIPLKIRSKGYKAVWSYTHDSLLRLGCLPSDHYNFEAENPLEQVPPFACSFSKTADSSHLLAVVDEDGFVTLVDTRHAADIVKVFRAHKNAIFDVAWASGKHHLVTASGDQTAALWDVAAGKPLGVFTGHSCSLKSVCFRPGDCHVFATGARDGNILVWDSRCNNRGGSQVCHHTAVNIIKEAHAEAARLRTTPSRKRSRNIPSMPVRGDNLSSVTVVNFQDDVSLFSAGATDSTIKVWDLRKCNKGMKKGPTPKQVYPYTGSSIKNGGFSSLVFNSTQSEFFASCTDDVIYRYSTLGSQTQPISTYHGHQNSSFYVKSALSRDDSLLLSGSGDSKAYIWNVDQPSSAPVTLCGHEDEVTMVAWAMDDFPKLVTGADDSSIRVWRLHKPEDTTHCRQSPSELIGYAEKTALSNNSVKASDTLAIQITGLRNDRATPPPKTKPKSDLEETRPEQTDSPPTTPKTPKPLTRRNSSISDWLKSSPKASQKEKASVPVGDKPELEIYSKSQQKSSNKTREHKTDTVGQRGDRQCNGSYSDAETLTEKQRIPGKDSVQKFCSKPQENANRTITSTTVLKNCNSPPRSDVISTPRLLGTPKDAPVLSNTKENIASQKENGLSPLHSETVGVRKMKSPFRGQKRKRHEPTENMAGGKQGVQKSDQLSANQNTSVLEGNESSPSRQVKRSRSLDLASEPGRALGRGRGLMTSHAQHDQCSCSCSGNHRHMVESSLARLETQEDLVEDSRRLIGSHKETSPDRDATKQMNGCSSSTRNICFYFRPHVRDVKRAFSDGALLKNGSYSPVSAAQASNV